jgi:hypothetical protein
MPAPTADRAPPGDLEKDAFGGLPPFSSAQQPRFLPQPKDPPQPAKPPTPSAAAPPASVESSNPFDLF